MPWCSCAMCAMGALNQKQDQEGQGIIEVDSRKSQKTSRSTHAQIAEKRI